MAGPVLEMKHISKRFDMTQALQDVSLTLYPGEVHALLGENGAGKSTLIKIMTGIHKPDEGGILLDGQAITIQHSADAQTYGIAAILQEPMIFPDLNVAENIFIAHHNIGPIIRWGKMYREATAILNKLDIKLDVRAQARGLTLAAQQAVEIAKAISLQVRVLIMDEPTASLSAHEVGQLFKLIRTLRNQGVAILFISHRMEEVFEIADRVTVLRDGRFISSAPRSEVTPEGAIRDMVGREMNEYFARSQAPRGELLLSVRGLRKENVFSDVTFDIHRGEVLGFAGLVGARRTDVGLALFGVEPADAGDIVWQGKNVPIHSPGQALRLGIAYVTEDRRQLGLTMPMSIAANISLPMLREYTSPLGLVKRPAENAVAEKFRERLAIRTPSVQREVSKLSGGNQQKVMLSKWLNAHPQLLILDEPTRGIDVGAKAEVHSMINDLAEQGLGIIVISSDLPEVLAMSDRILVMREGRQVAIFDRAEATQERVLTAAME
ncbi:MAG: sugar ABC transporter ATP-binding protein [Chloroflexi bacterium]|nr:sugar ABC transporter ATP-binding protein [Chloroflexota bacterium]MCI0576173.1 sugar ABC transporter ATP-binding protein [Chloroflexota bacterium]MCI0648974.1 sugar ABC transporter ATP-binding protein [Chloroflexota bacterium]MCI0728190.1 sugar ABC transporter ATP-binding protein [Chloroflexota bacterium]